MLKNYDDKLRWNSLCGFWSQSVLVTKATVGVSASTMSSGIVPDSITINSSKSLAVALRRFIRMMLLKRPRCLLLVSSHGNETHGGRGGVASIWLISVDVMCCVTQRSVQGWVVFSSTFTLLIADVLSFFYVLRKVSSSRPRSATG